MKLKAFGRYGSVGFELLASIAIGYLFGHWLDTRYSLGGWVTGLFTIAGVYAGFRSLFKAAKQMQHDIEKEEKLERGEHPWSVPMPEGYEDGKCPPPEPAGEGEQDAREGEEARDTKGTRGGEDDKDHGT